jgi:hypothetical protein
MGELEVGLEQARFHRTVAAVLLSPAVAAKAHRYRVIGQWSAVSLIFGTY